ncbi:MAG: NCS2 family permease [bacterium]|jgi:AGZA family xanthine/uracil permease-like MFS transporter
MSTVARAEKASLNAGQASLLERLFKLSAHNTDVKTEVMAGLVTFMTMAYVIAVHPNIMAAAGMPVEAVMVTTILTTALSTLHMALYTNRPFALAPAMGSNAFFAYTLVAGGVTDWQTALGIVLISGTIFVLLTLGGLREMITKAIPATIKLSIGAAVGLFIALLGFNNAGLVKVNETTGLLALGNFWETEAILAIIGFFIISVLMALRVRGALLAGILITTVIGIPMGITQVPSSIFSLPPSIAPIAFKFNLLGALKLAFIPAIFTFFMGDFFSTLGTVLGVSGKAGLLDKDGNLPEIQKPFLVDAIHTCVGAMLGTPTVTTYVESASGVEAGGRTGLTALVTSLAFFACLFITPLALMIPNAATAPVLMIIGLLMMPAVKNINFDDFTQSLPAFITIVVTVFTFNLANGMALGVISYVILHVFSGKYREVPVGLYVLCLPLAYYFYLMKP